MRAVLSAATLLSIAPFPLAAQGGTVQIQTRDSAPVCTCSTSRKPNIFYFGKARGEGPVIGVETSSGSVRDTLGVLVIGVTNNGPADKAGIEEGDRIASANGVDLRLSSADAGDRDLPRGLMARRLARAVQKAKVGDAIDLRVYHNGEYRNVKVTTVKGSDLSMDIGDIGDVGYEAIDRLPTMLHSLDDMRFDMPEMRMKLPDMYDLGQRIKMQLRPLSKLKTMPIEIYDDGIHRM